METTQTTTIDLPRFGPCEFSEADVIEFPWGLPGFPSYRRWLALNVDTHGDFVWLQSLDDLKVALPTADPYGFFPDYSPSMPAYAAAALDITSPAEFTVLGVVVVTPNAEEMTMNLFAPIIVNLRTKKGRQIVLDNSGYSVRQPLPRRAKGEGQG